MRNDIQQATAFFKSEKAYQSLFEQFRKKYESLGRIGGTIPVRLFSRNELEVIGRFFGMSADKLEAKKSISVVAFEQQLQDTRFQGVSLKQLLDTYFGEVVISKKQLKQNKEEKLHTLLCSLKEKYPVMTFWLDHLSGSPVEGRWILRIAEDDPHQFSQLIGVLATALDSLPATAERLPMFSQRITADPHAFDLHTDLGKMLLHVLAIKMNGEISVPSSTEAVNELLKNYHIYRDDLLNFVTCAGFYAETRGAVHPVWQAAVDYHTVQNIPLRELTSVDRVYPAKGSDVWIVENSGVCSTLLDYKPDMTIICTNGQFKLAALMLMDLLVEEGCTLHYAGDFDPEGLGMAQRLLDRYPNHAKLWRMNLAAYQKTAPVKELTAERLEKLHGITNDELSLVADEMRILGKAGYQEALVELMVEDVSE
ncbi:TIGR02679 family protein [Lentibacillus sp. Marseille-P4043]|uniref:TIGR02679 family protein n=1 Tax=Lentibacillus sp. Marseille-P4043 TaxID=2040293 RepID=UPI000D0B90AE|nr:TIGR02679 family protein [Lentibacillus sp. Marseille-P4043]